MRKMSQGRRWRKLDNTGKLFPVITDENLTNVFRLSATLKEEINPVLLQKALEDILPWFEGFRVKLHKGFFWYYFETNRKTPLAEKEETYPCRYIDPHGNRQFLFRVSYYGSRINLEVFHAVTDGLGSVNFLRELVYRYLQLKKDQDFIKPSDQCMREIEDSYVKNYKKVRKSAYRSPKAFKISGKLLPLDTENIVHGYIPLDQLKLVCKKHKVTITKYLTACLIWSIYQEYLLGNIDMQKIGISLPVNLRAFFGSNTTANFFAVILVSYIKNAGANAAFDEILQVVSEQMDDKIVKDKMEEIISYNVSNEKKWLIRIVPLFIKKAVVRQIFMKNEKNYTMTLSNIGPIEISPEYAEEIERFHMVIGVSRKQPVKLAVCAYENELVASFTSVFQDIRLQKRFFDTLKEEGISSRIESNGAVEKEHDRGMYPKIAYDPEKWKKLIPFFYAMALILTAALGIINSIMYDGVHWPIVGIVGVLYVTAMIRYSIFRRSDLGFKILLQVLGMQALLIVLDYMFGYDGWSINYAVPGIIQFADLAIVFLIIVNRMNWQSYFMYQITVTIFSFVPLVLWAAGLITKPFLSVCTVLISVAILALTVLLGDRSVKRELKRRFHL